MKTLALKLGAVLFAVGLIVSCDQIMAPEQKDGGIDVPKIPSPRLSSLTIESESAGYVLSDANGNSVDFNSETFSYTVQLTPGEAPPTIKLVAVPVTPFTVDYNGLQEFVPVNGQVVTISVVEPITRLSQNYRITFTAGDLPPALISDILLTVGAVPNFTKTIQNYNVSLPYVQNKTVAVSVSGEAPNSAFSFSPGSSITLASVAGMDGYSGIMEITVSAPGHAPTQYAFNFSMQEPSPSALNGITLSSGVLTGNLSATVPFDPAPAEGAIQYITLPAGTTGFVVTAEKNQGAIVTFDVTAPLIGAILSDGCSVSFTGGPFVAASNNEFTITVNDGPGYRDTVYTFQIIQSQITAAQLTSLTASGSGVNLFQREQNGTNGVAGFASEHLLYNLNFEFVSNTAVITAAADAGAIVKINGTQTDTLSGVTYSTSPIQVSVEKANHLTTVYTLYPKLENPEIAQLTALTVAGGTLTNASNQPVAFDAAVYNYNVRVLLNAAANPALMVTGTAGAGFAVSYPGTHGNYISSVTAAVNGSTIIVRVEGGSGYNPGVYTLTVHTVEPKNPRLTSLSVNGTALAGFAENTLYYARTLGSTETSVSLGWTPNNDVAAVQYSLNNGVNWSNAVSGNSVSNIVTLNSGESKMVYVKAYADDGANTIYVINFTVAPPASVESKNPRLTGLRVNGTALAGFAPNILFYARTLGSTETSVSLDWMPNNDVAAVQYSLNNGVNWSNAVSGNSVSNIVTLNSGESKMVYIKASADDSVNTIYVINFTVAPPASAEPKNPQLISLRVNGTALAGFAPNILYYERTLDITETSVSLDWMPNNDVTAVQYSLNNGAAWSKAVSGNSVSNIVTLNSGESKMIFIKASAADSVNTIYVINLTVASSAPPAPTAFLESLRVNGLEIAVNSVMRPTYYALQYPQGAFEIQATGTPGATFSWDGASPSTGDIVTVPALIADKTKTVTVTVSGQSNTYTLIFYKPPAYYFNENAPLGGSGETPDSPLNNFASTLARAKASGINKVEIIGGITAVSSIGGSSESIFHFNNGLGTLENPFIIRNFHFSNGSNGKRIISVESSVGKDNVIVFENPRIQGAVTDQNGAGMYITAAPNSSTHVTVKATANLGAPLVYNNHSNGNGGGIAIEGPPNSGSGEEGSGEVKLYLRDETETFQDLISGNEAFGNGGGLYLSNATTVEMSKGKIKNNISRQGAGGGIYATDNFGILLDGYITGNTADEDGGGIYIVRPILFSVRGYISENTAGGNGGGMYMGAAGTSDVSSNYLNGEVRGNTARGNGGGIYLQGDASELAKLTIASSFYTALPNAIISNTAGTGTSGGIGGAMYLSKANVTFYLAADITQNVGNGRSGTNCTSGLHIENNSTIRFNEPVYFAGNLSAANSRQILKKPYSNNIIYNSSNITYPSRDTIGDGFALESSDSSPDSPPDEGFALTWRILDPGAGMPPAF